jgi:hypothetical protein
LLTGHRKIGTVPDAFKQGAAAKDDDGAADGANGGGGDAGYEGDEARTFAVFFEVWGGDDGEEVAGDWARRLQILSNDKKAPGRVSTGGWMV